MHQPTAFVQTDAIELQALVAQYPLATLVVLSAGDLLINHIPLVWNDKELHGHIPRSNELVSVLQASPQGLTATAVFQGPEGYISPADYPTKLSTGKVVPTWNYAVAHLSGLLRLRNDNHFVRQQIDQLTEQQETISNPGEPWTLNDAPEEFSSALLKSIVGIALSIDLVEGKYKLSQNRDAADRAGAAGGALSRGDSELATMMRKFAAD